VLASIPWHLVPKWPKGVRPCNNACGKCLTEPSEVGAVPLDEAPERRDVILCGYEPLLDPGLPARVKAVLVRGSRVVALVTNGRLCNYDQVVRKLADLNIEHVVVKLFGCDGAGHDAHTGADGSFDQALGGIRRLRSAGLRVSVTYPLQGDRFDLEGAGRDPFLDLAYRLTNTLPVVMPSSRGDRGLRPVMVHRREGPAGMDPDHEGGGRYDVIVVDREPDSRHWSPPLLPMVHIMVGMMCNNRCVYCNVRGGEHQTLYDKAYVHALLEDAAKRFLPDGPFTADFIGGEPTLHPDLPDLIAEARRTGFPSVTVCTNGRRLARDGYLDTLAKAGLTGVRYSMHDHRPRVAGKLAGRTGDGDLYLRTARELLGRRDITPYLYRIVLSPNLEALPDHLKWLSDHNRTGRPLDLHMGLPSPRGRLYENPDLFPDLHEARRAVTEALELADGLGIDITLYHSPGCLVPGVPERSAILHLRTLQVDAGTGAVTRLNFEGDTRLAAACDACVEKDRCCGLAEHYFQADPEAVEAWVRPYGD